MSLNDYDIIIGLEVHSELSTNTKIFCGCTTEFGGEPNTHCCPGCIAMPGVLPVLNGKVVEYGIKAGLATNCKINNICNQDRKNYFYPDLPAAYQISQLDYPLCINGFIEIDVEGKKKKIRLNRIHIEEDAGKLLHAAGEGSLVDYNRGSSPLIEIVSEPDINSSVEARAYLEKLRTILLYTGVSDCKMNEGSFRCDVNLSLRKKGEEKFGTRTEMKNMNSFNFIVKAIEYEARRQAQILDEGGVIVQETRRWDENKGITLSMRTKGEAHDYRYFPDPDLMPIVTSDEMIEKIRKTLPELPDSKKARYLKEYGLSEYDADLLIASRKMAEFFEKASSICENKKSVANWIIIDIFQRLTEHEKEEAIIPFDALLLGELVNLIDEDVISISIAKTVFADMWETGKRPEEIITEKGLRQISDDSALKEMAKEAIEGNSKAVEDYLNGKSAALNILMGQIMKKTKGQANPKAIMSILKEMLEAMK